MKFLFFLLCAGASASAVAQVPQAKIYAARDWSWRARVESYPNGQKQIHLQLPSRKVIHTLFYKNGGVGRFWISGVSPDDQRIEMKDQDHMRRVLMTEAVPNFSDAPEIALFLDFVANFLPPNEVIAPFEARERVGASITWTMICSSIGKARMASFSAQQRRLKDSAVVGDPRSRCRGRCGVGCGTWGEWRLRQYTQECLAHDLCRDHTGYNLGECADEFWAASSGFMFAPDCER